MLRGAVLCVLSLAALAGWATPRAEACRVGFVGVAIRSPVCPVRVAVRGPLVRVRVPGVGRVRIRGVPPVVVAPVVPLPAIFLPRPTIVLPGPVVMPSAPPPVIQVPPGAPPVVLPK